MSQSFSRNQSDNTYVIEGENGADMARLIDQDGFFTRMMGGLFSERDDLSSVFDVLDIGCGPGGWVLDVAHHYPEMEVTGIDIGKGMIQYAQAYAQVRKLPNAHFQVMNALNPLDFPDNSFDLINARLIVSFVYPHLWPALIAECRRILRPGGILRLTEPEWGFTNKVGLETLYGMLSEAYFRTGRSFSSTGKHLGITAVLEHLLRTNGFQATSCKAHVINYSVGMPSAQPMYEDLKVVFQLLQPFMVSSGVVSSQEIESLYEKALLEMQEDDFCAVWYMLTVWGEAQ